MNTEITLRDDAGQPVIKLSDCDDKEYVCITFVLGGTSAEVSIDELKHALRKISVR